MKYLVLLLSVVLLSTSCSVDEPEVVLYENAVLVNVLPPDQLIFGQTATFEVTYVRPTSCHSFGRYDLVEEGQTIIIRTETRFDNQSICEQTPEFQSTQSFEYLIDSQNDYTFSFLANVSDTEQLEYITFQLPVETE